MSSSDGTSLLSLLLGLCPLCASLLGLLGLAGLLLWRLQHRLQQQQPLSGAEWRIEQEKMHAKVTTLMPKVQPWHPEVLSGLHTSQHTRWMVFGRHARLWGLIVEHRLKHPWAAFALYGQRVFHAPVTVVGQAYAQTTAQTFEYQSDSSGKISVTVDGRWLGNLQPNGVLLNASGQSIGRQIRHGTGQPLTLLSLHGRVVARLAIPSIEVVASDLTSDERDWLTALILWQVINRAGAQITTSYGARPGL